VWIKKVNFISKLCLQVIKAWKPLKKNLPLKKQNDYYTGEGDSVLSFQAKLVDLGSRSETPVPEVVVSIFAKRLFNCLAGRRHYR
jgi:hypothetical protein